MSKRPEPPIPPGAVIYFGGLERQKEFFISQKEPFEGEVQYKLERYVSGCGWKSFKSVTVPIQVVQFLADYIGWDLTD